MKEPVTLATSVVLVGIGVAADLWLAREFVGAWRESRRPARKSRRSLTRSTPRGQSLPGALVATTVGIMLALCPASAAAQNAGEPPAEPTLTPDVHGSAIGVQLNLDYSTAYFYRGIVQEDSGLILQPAARLTLNLADEREYKLDGFIGAWNSVHGQKTGARTEDDLTAYWYECDVYAGFSVTTGKLALTATYTFLTSPNDAFETVQELGFSAALDDSEWLGAWAMKPSVTIAMETGADASDGANSDPGTYLEFGVSPGFSLNAGTTPVTLTFPASIGLSLSDYYQDAAGDDDTFGFAQVGARAAIPLGEPGRLGTWTLNTGVSVLLLGDHTEAYNGGDDTEVIGTIGIQWNF